MPRYRCASCGAAGSSSRRFSTGLPPRVDAPGGCDGGRRWRWWWWCATTEGGGRRGQDGAGGDRTSRSEPVLHELTSLRPVLAPRTLDGVPPPPSTPSHRARHPCSLPLASHRHTAIDKYTRTHIHTYPIRTYIHTPHTCIHHTGPLRPRMIH